MLWTPKRLPGKNLACAISLGDGFAVLNSADVPDPCSYVVRPAFRADVPPLAGLRLHVTVNPHGCPDELPGHWRLMRPGVKSGLSDDAGALAGNHVLHQAISLAVHLGFSRVHLQAPEPDPRLRRAMDSLVRPLRHRRVTVTGCAPFPVE